MGYRAGVDQRRGDRSYLMAVVVVVGVGVVGRMWKELVGELVVGDGVGGGGGGNG